MPGFHEFDVALSPNTPVAAASTRTPTNEVHVNPWATGTKSAPVLILSDAANIAAGIGLTLAPARQTAQANAPAELVLGDASGAWLLNIADLNVSSGGAVPDTLFAGVFLY